MLRRSIARCQPGLYCRCPSTDEVLRPLLERLDLRRATRSSSARGADDADQVVHRLLEVLLDRVGVLAARPDLERRQRALLGRLQRPRRTRAGRASPRPAAYAAAASPARRPNTSRSDSELPPSRLEPCMPPEHSPTAYSPVDARSCSVSGVDLDAAHHVVAGRADLHRLGGDVDVGQLLELVVHRRQPLADELRAYAARRCRGRCRRARAPAGLDLGVDRPGDLVTRAAARVGDGCSSCRRTSGRPPPRCRPSPP